MDHPERDPHDLFPFGDPRIDEWGESTPTRHPFRLTLARLVLWSGCVILFLGLRRYAQETGNFFAAFLGFAALWVLGYEVVFFGLAMIGAMPIETNRRRRFDRDVRVRRCRGPVCSFAMVPLRACLERVT